MSRLVVVSNRGPYRETGSGARRQVVRAAGGLVTALDPVLRDRGGVWVSAQETDHPLVVPAHPGSYELSEVQIAKRDRDAFYGPLSNGVLWPVLHSMPPTVGLGSAPFESYVVANRAFADAAVEAGGDGGFYWIHDYHLMLVPRFIRDARPDARIGWFCHIPWPGPDLFATLPWRIEMLEGLLAADVLGFHTETFAKRFLSCVQHLTELEVDDDARTIKVGDHVARVIVAPIGVPYDEIQELATSSEVEYRTQTIRRLVYDRTMILGVDRLDYTKGVPERLRAFERLLAKNPKIREKVLLVQVMVPSRQAVQAYRELKDEVDRLVGDINGRYSVTGRVPIHYFYRSLKPAELYAHYRAADVALITPLRDGMNLVAHEYCAARVEEDGALILSEFAGAAQWLTDAIVVNPHDVVETTAALQTAIRMPRAEQQKRMRALRQTVASLDVHGWAAGYLSALERAR